MSPQVQRYEMWILEVALGSHIRKCGYTVVRKKGSGHWTYRGGVTARLPRKALEKAQLHLRLSDGYDLQHWLQCDTASCYHRNTHRASEK